MARMFLLLLLFKKGPINFANIQFIEMNLRFSATAIGRLRLVGISEGISYILLLFIAMPLKYLMNLSQPVWYIGWIHGLLFLLFILALIYVTITLEWKFKKVFFAFIAALLPFGTFILDKSWKKEEGLFLEKR